MLGFKQAPQRDRNLDLSDQPQHWAEIRTLAPQSATRGRISVCPASVYSQRPPQVAEAIFSADMQRQSLRGRNRRKTWTLRKAPLDSNLPSACLLDPFLVLNYFLQTGAYKKKKTRIRHSRQSQKLSKLLPQNKLPNGTVNSASIKPLPSETQVHSSEGRKLQTRLSAHTAQNRACPWARGHRRWQDPSLGSPQQCLLNRGRLRQMAGTHVLTTWKQSWGERETAVLTSPR